MFENSKSLWHEGYIVLVHQTFIRRQLDSSYGASQVVPVVKSPSANAGDMRDAGSIPGSEIPWRRINRLSYCKFPEPCEVSKSGVDESQAEGAYGEEVKSRNHLRLMVKDI